MSEILLTRDAKFVGRAFCRTRTKSTYRAHVGLWSSDHNVLCLSCRALWSTYLKGACWARCWAHKISCGAGLGSDSAFWFFFCISTPYFEKNKWIRDGGYWPSFQQLAIIPNLGIYRSGMLASEAFHKEMRCTRYLWLISFSDHELSITMQRLLHFRPHGNFVVCMNKEVPIWYLCQPPSLWLSFFGPCCIHHEFSSFYHAIIRTPDKFNAPRWGRQIPPPLPDFLDSSKTMADTDPKRLVTTQHQLDVLNGNLKKMSRCLWANGVLVTSCFAVR